MKAGEIRECLQGWPVEDIIKLYIATYRKVPLGKRDELDELLEEGVSAPKLKPVPRHPGKKDLEEAIEELDVFIYQARAGYYCHENKTVGKMERSQWKERIKRFLKLFKNVDPDTPFYDLANLQLCKLYDLLGFASTFETFQAEEPFLALKYEEGELDFFTFLAERILAGSRSDKTLRALVQCAGNGYEDSHSSVSGVQNTIFELVTDKEELRRILTLALDLFHPVKERYEAFQAGELGKLSKRQETELFCQWTSLYILIGALYLNLEEPMKAYDFIRDTNQDPEAIFELLLLYDAPCASWLQAYERAKEDKLPIISRLESEYKNRLRG